MVEKTPLFLTFVGLFLFFYHSGLLLGVITVFSGSPLPKMSLSPISVKKFHLRYFLSANVDLHLIGQ